MEEDDLPLDKLQVEIRDPQKMNCDISQALPEDPTLIETLSEVRRRMFPYCEERAD
jgi:hypothetical protein